MRLSKIFESEMLPDRPASMADAARLSQGSPITHVCSWCNNIVNPDGSRGGPNVSGAEKDGICTECSQMVSQQSEEGIAATGNLQQQNEIEARREMEALRARLT